MAEKDAENVQGGVSHGTSGRIVLVGTYKGDQLTKWRGWYNCPISEGDLSHAEAQRRGGNELVTDCDQSYLSKINELWLFNGTKDERNCKAECGTGFTRTNLRNMRQFYLMFPNRHTVCGKLSWSHYRTLITVESNDATKQICSLPWRLQGPSSVESREYGNGKPSKSRR